MYNIQDVNDKNNLKAWVKHHSCDVYNTVLVRP